MGRTSTEIDTDSFKNPQRRPKHVAKLINAAREANFKDSLRASSAPDRSCNTDSPKVLCNLR